MVMIRSTLILLALACVLYAPEGFAQGSYVIKRDDTLLTMSEALRPPQATLNQMGLALVRANLHEFQTRTTLQLPAGTKLVVPSAGVVLGTDAATAEVEFGKIWRADQHYRAALALEKSHDMLFAFDTYVYAARLGHGRAQLRLGQLYDRDLSGFVRRDLQ